jgi:hypothetical protein
MPDSKYKLTSISTKKEDHDLLDKIRSKLIPGITVNKTQAISYIIKEKAKQLNII